MGSSLKAKGTGCVMTNSRYACIVVVLSASITLATAAVAQHYAGGHASTYVVGDCPSGFCIPNPANYGYYQTGWRRWPTSIPASPHLEQPAAGPIESLPPAELPDPHFESDIIAPRRGGASPRTESLPSLPDPNPIAPPPPSRIEDPTPTLPPFELPARSPEQGDSSYSVPRTPAVVAQANTISIREDRLVAFPVQQNQTAEQSADLAANSSTNLPANVSIKALPPTAPKRIHHIFLPQQRGSDTRPSSTSLTLGRRSVVPSPKKAPRHVEAQRTVAPVSWQNPFRSGSIEGVSVEEPALSPTTTPKLPPLVEEVAVDNSSQRNPEEPRRIELPELISPLPPVERSVASEDVLLEVATKRNPVRPTSAVEPASPTSRPSLVSGNPLRSRASTLEDQAKRAANPLRPDDRNPIRGASDAKADGVFRNPLRN